MIKNIDDNCGMSTYPTAYDEIDTINNIKLTKLTVATGTTNEIETTTVTKNMNMVVMIYETTTMNTNMCPTTMNMADLYVTFTNTDLPTTYSPPPSLLPRPANMVGRVEVETNKYEEGSTMLD